MTNPHEPAEPTGPPPPPLPSRTGGAQPTGGGRPTVGLRGDHFTALIAGNWLGSALVAALTLATAGVLSLILGLVAKPADFGVDNTLTFGAVIFAGIFGADLFFRGAE